MSDELPPRLTALISGERDAPTGDRRRVRAQLSTSLGIAAASSTLAAASAIASKLVIFALAVGAVGGGAALFVHERRTAIPTTATPAPAPATPTDPAATATARTPTPEPGTPTPEPVTAPAPVRARARVPAPVLVPAPASTSASSAVAVSAPAASPMIVAVADPAADSGSIPAANPRVSTSTADQRTLLALAWSALSRGDNRGALTLLDQDASHHPDAPLEEERDALHIETLRRLGRVSDADREARAFLARFPDSVHRALVAHALTKESP